MVYSLLLFLTATTEALSNNSNNSQGLPPIMVPTLVAMAPHLLAMASNLRATASNLLAMASNLMAPCLFSYMTLCFVSFATRFSVLVEHVQELNATARAFRVLHKQLLMGAPNTTDQIALKQVTNLCIIRHRLRTC